MGLFDDLPNEAPVAVTSGGSGLFDDIPGPAAETPRQKVRTPKQIEIQSQLDALRAERAKGQVGGTLAAAGAAGIEQGSTLINRMGRNIGDALGIANFLDDLVGAKGDERNQAWLDYYAARDKRLAKDVSELAGDSTVLNTVGDIVQATTRGVTELPTQLMGGAAMRTPEAALAGSALLSGMMSASSEYGQRRAEGEGRSTAIPSALTSGLITTVVTRGFGNTGVEDVFNNSGFRGIGAGLLNGLKQAGHEAAEEATDQILQDMFERYQRNPDKPIKDTLYEAMIAGLAGAGTSATMSAYSAPRDYISGRLNDRRELNDAFLGGPSQPPATTITPAEQRNLRGDPALVGLPPSDQAAILAGRRAQAQRFGNERAVRAAQEAREARAAEARAQEQRRQQRIAEAAALEAEIQANEEAARLATARATAADVGRQRTQAWEDSVSVAELNNMERQLAQQPGNEQRIAYLQSVRKRKSIQANQAGAPQPAFTPALQNQTAGAAPGISDAELAGVIGQAAQDASIARNLAEARRQQAEFMAGRQAQPQAGITPNQAAAAAGIADEITAEGRIAGELEAGRRQQSELAARAASERAARPVDNLIQTSLDEARQQQAAMLERINRERAEKVAQYEAQVAQSAIDEQMAAARQQQADFMRQRGDIPPETITVGDQSFGVQETTGNPDPYYLAGALPQRLPDLPARKVVSYVQDPERTTDKWIAHKPVVTGTKTPTRSDKRGPAAIASDMLADAVRGFTHKVPARLTDDEKAADAESVRKGGRKAVRKSKLVDEKVDPVSADKAIDKVVEWVRKTFKGFLDSKPFVPHKAAGQLPAAETLEQEVAGLEARIAAIQERLQSMSRVGTLGEQRKQLRRELAERVDRLGKLKNEVALRQALAAQVGRIPGYRLADTGAYLGKTKAEAQESLERLVAEQNKPFIPPELQAAVEERKQPTIQGTGTLKSIGLGQRPEKKGGKEVKLTPMERFGIRGERPPKLEQSPETPRPRKLRFRELPKSATPVLSESTLRRRRKKIETGEAPSNFPVVRQQPEPELGNRQPGSLAAQQGSELWLRLKELGWPDRKLADKSELWGNSVAAQGKTYESALQDGTQSLDPAPGSITDQQLVWFTNRFYDHNQVAQMSEQQAAALMTMYGNGPALRKVPGFTPRILKGEDAGVAIARSAPGSEAFFGKTEIVGTGRKLRKQNIDNRGSLSEAQKRSERMERQAMAKQKPETLEHWLAVSEKLMRLRNWAANPDSTLATMTDDERDAMEDYSKLTGLAYEPSGDLVKRFFSDEKAKFFLEQSFGWAYDDFNHKLRAEIADDLIKEERSLIEQAVRDGVMTINQADKAEGKAHYKTMKQLWGELRGLKNLTERIQRTKSAIDSYIKLAKPISERRKLGRITSPITGKGVEPGREELDAAKWRTYNQRIRLLRNLLKADEETQFKIAEHMQKRAAEMARIRESRRAKALGEKKVQLLRSAESDIRMTTSAQARHTQFLNEFLGKVERAMDDVEKRLGRMVDGKTFSNAIDAALVAVGLPPIVLPTVLVAKLGVQGAKLTIKTLRAAVEKTGDIVAAIESTVAWLKQKFPKLTETDVGEIENHMKAAGVAFEFVPALRTADGTVIPGELGKTHADIYNSRPKVESLELKVSNPEHGFLHNGQFLTREQASQILGEQVPLQSERLAEIQSGALTDDFFLTNESTATTPRPAVIPPVNQPFPNAASAEAAAATTDISPEQKARVERQAAAQAGVFSEQAVAQIASLFQSGPRPQGVNNAALNVEKAALRDLFGYMTTSSNALPLQSVPEEQRRQAALIISVQHEHIRILRERIQAKLNVAQKALSASKPGDKKHDALVNRVAGLTEALNKMRSVMGDATYSAKVKEAATTVGMHHGYFSRIGSDIKVVDPVTKAKVSVSMLPSQVNEEANHEKLRDLIGNITMYVTDPASDPVDAAGYADALEKLKWAYSSASFTPSIYNYSQMDHTKLVPFLRTRINVAEQLGGRIGTMMRNAFLQSDAVQRQIYNITSNKEYGTEALQNAQLRAMESHGLGASPEAVSIWLYEIAAPLAASMQNHRSVHYSVGDTTGFDHKITQEDMDFVKTQYKLEQAIRKITDTKTYGFGEVVNIRRDTGANNVVYTRPVETGPMTLSGGVEPWAKSLAGEWGEMIPVPMPDTSRMSPTEAALATRQNAIENARRQALRTAKLEEIIADRFLFQKTIMGMVENLNPDFDSKSEFKPEFLQIARKIRHGEILINNMDELVLEIARLRGTDTSQPVEYKHMVRNPETGEWGEVTEMIPFGQYVRNKVLGDMAQTLNNFSAKAVKPKSERTLEDVTGAVLENLSATNSFTDPRGKPLAPSSFYRYAKATGYDIGGFLKGVHTIYQIKELEALEQAASAMLEYEEAMSNELQRLQSSGRSEREARQILNARVYEGAYRYNREQAKAMREAITGEVNHLKRIIAHWDEDLTPSLARFASETGRVINSTLMTSPKAVAGNVIPGAGFFTGLVVDGHTRTIRDALVNFAKTPYYLARAAWGYAARGAVRFGVSRKMLEPFPAILRHFEDMAHENNQIAHRLREMGINAPANIGLRWQQGMKQLKMQYGDLRKDSNALTAALKVFFQGGNTLYESGVSGARRPTMLHKMFASPMNWVNQMALYPIASALPRWGDMYANMALHYRLEATKSWMASWAKRIGESREAQGLTLDPADPSQLIKPEELGIDKRKMRWVRTYWAPVGTIEQVLFDYYNRWKVAADKDAVDLLGDNPELAEQRHRALQASYSSLENTITKANAPSSAQGAEWRRIAFALKSYSANAANQVMKLMPNGFAPQVSWRDKEVLAALMMFLAVLLSFAAAGALTTESKEALGALTTGRLPSMPTAVNLAGALASGDLNAAEAARYGGLAMGTMVPYVGNFIDRTGGGGSSRSPLDLTGIIPMAQFAKDLVDTGVRSAQSGDFTKGAIDIINRYGGIYAVPLNRLPVAANDLQARNTLRSLRAVTPRDVEMRSFGSGGTPNATPLTRFLRQAETASYAGDRAGVRSALDNAIRFKMQTKGLSQADAAQEVRQQLGARDPEIRVYGRKLADTERRRVLSRMSDAQRSAYDTGLRAYDLIRSTIPARAQARKKPGLRNRRRSSLRGRKLRSVA